MEFKTANREWVKNAAIIFLAVLLVLTFFSNTIMNRSLVEVATARVTDGNIVAKVRGTGTVTASGKHQVKATKTRTVRSVMVKAGQEVQTGDVLFILGEGDGDELEQAEQTLRELRVSYQKAAISMPTFNYNLQERELSLAEGKMNDAWEAYAAAEDALAHAPGVDQIALAEAKDLLKKATDYYNNLVDDLNQQIAEADAEVNKTYDELIGLPETATKEEIEEKQEAYEKAVEARNSIQTPVELENAKTQMDKYQARVDSLSSAAATYQAAVEKALEDYNTAENDYYEKFYALEKQKEDDQKSVALAQIELSSIADQIARQQEKIKSLAGEDDNTVTANVSGKIDTIDCTAGDTVTKDSLMCTIEVPDMGHTVSFSVTNDQAQRLRTGDTATVSNYYWGNTITATLTNIRTDPKNPQTNKLLTFDLEGDVTTGSELTLSVGQKSANYDTIVPNSAIRTDNNGSFVLAISQKSSPLGNRYIAKRVSIEVLASDDNNSAVVADLGNGDYVITTGSGPIKNGDQVRMADSSEG
ncbi:MAG: HlyD family efflux transporter periplasmic adaptor subunit [Candidatus Limivicinus sp.]|nr:HlyD family efflux transporter periplasmic adaptor subunit [Candidatus Limivicinus sp.]